MAKTLIAVFSRYLPDSEGRIFLENAKLVGNIRVDKHLRMLEVDFSYAELLPKSKLYRLENEIAKAYALNSVRLLPKYPQGLFSEAYFPEIMYEAYRTNIISKSFLQEYKATFEGDRITIDIMFGNGGVHFVEYNHIGEKIAAIIFKEFGLQYKFSFRKANGYVSDRSERMEKELSRFRTAKPAIAQTTNENVGTPVNTEKSPSVYKTPTKTFTDDDGYLHIGNSVFDFTDASPLIGEAFEIKPSPIFSMRYPKDSVILVGEILGKEIAERKTKGKYKTEFCITDYEATIMARFGITDEELPKYQELSDGMQVAVRGSLHYDDFDRELVLTPFAIMQIKKIGRMDCAPEKRVELHLHTNMSQMDAIIPPDVVVKTAHKWGHKAVAITDHGNVQGYQEAMKAAGKLGMKVIYGMEAYFVNDEEKTVYGDTHVNFHDEFVVFDIETTGLSSLSSKITEIGAVLVKNDEVLSVFNTFVNPEMPIPEDIVELTGITDEMVTDAPKTKEAVQKFLDFIGDRMLVAHNASFDISFIRKAAQDHDLPFNNTYLDTLSMSRFVNPDLKNHKLNTIADYFKLGDFNHHRASDDAEMTAKIFYRMAAKLENDGVSTTAEMSAAMADRTDPLKLNTYHMIILVKNAEGLKNLYKMISFSYLKYYKKRPRIPKTLLDEHREGLIIGSACEAGELYSAIMASKPWDELVSIANFYDYLEIQPLCNNSFMIAKNMVSGEEELKKINQKIIQLGEETGKPVVATCDAHFMDKTDEIYRKILLAGMKYDDVDHDTGLYMRTTEEMLAEFSYLGEEKAHEVVITNTNKIADMVEDGIRPFPDGTFTPKMEGAEEDLRRICYERAESLYGNPLPQIVEKRLDKELTSIIKNGFAVLYMIAQKLVWYSEQQGYLVGSRGSVGSSFVASMAGISEVNPLPPHYYCPNCKYSQFILDGSYGSGFDLPDAKCPCCGTDMRGDGHDIPFETFLGFYGDKSPDIDLNFSGEVQGKVHKYTEELFGAENVFRAGTIGGVADKTAFGYASKYAEERNIPLSKAEIIRLTKKCIGVKRTTGQHPGGIVVVPKEYDIYDFCPVQHPADDPNSDIITTHFTFEYLHDTLLKLDELGHDIPTKYKYLERFSGLNVMELPMNDQEVYELFRSTQTLGATPDEIGGCKIGTLGLPEFGTAFVMPVVIEARPKNFNDLLQISGLTHGTGLWLGNAQDLIKNGICDISKVVGTRDSIMLALIRYGLDDSTSFKIMEFVRKNKAGKPIPDNMLAAMREKNVDEWYIDSLTKIRYMFPKAHAAAYVMSAIRLGWFKVHQPIVFYCAYFSAAPGGFDGSIASKGKARVAKLINDLKAKDKKERTQKDDDTIAAMQIALECLGRGYRFLPVDLYKSDARMFLPENNAIRLPFGSLPGLGEAAALKLQEARADGEYFSVEDLKQRTGISKAVIEILTEGGVLDGLSETNQLRLF
ncbi:MAG: PolC-type DNA polymerase III [Clostridia bacterium]|nr:PolC-type DNA polymerase III [Clostridia bacterium]